MIIAKNEDVTWKGGAAMSQKKVSLCSDCQHCPTVAFLGDEVRIGEHDNLVILKKAEWNTLVAKIKSGELQPL